MFKSIIVLLILMVASACTKTGQSRSDAIKKEGEYITDAAIWNWLQGGTVLCYNQNSEGTCTGVQFPSGIGKTDGNTTTIYLLSANELFKVAATQKLTSREDGFICSRMSTGFLESHSFYRAGDAKAWVGDLDKLFTPSETQAAIDHMIRVNNQTMGREHCLRYLVTKLGENGSVEQVQEHVFIDGIRQKRLIDPLITFFDMEFAKNRLRLRPSEE